jgi:hypothetical protein
MSTKQSYESLRREAELVRDRLMVTLDTLDQKRHELTDVKLQMKRHPAVVWSGGGVVAAVIGIVGFLAYRRARREQSPWRERARALGRAWKQPHRIASGKQGPFAAELGRKILLGIAGFTAVELGKTGIRRFLPGRG